MIEREKALQEQLKSEQTTNAERARELAGAREERERLEAALNREKAEKEQLAAEQRRTKESNPPSQAPGSQPKISFASFILAPALRGGAQIQSLSIPARTDRVRIKLELEADPYASYRVALTDSGGRTLWRSGALKAAGKGENRSLNVQFPAGMLKSQIYTLSVSGVAPTGEAQIFSNYSFRAVLE